jgi:hypothetical protein
MTDDDGGLFHSGFASLAGATVANVSPFTDMLSKFIVGTAVGVSVWCITKLISYSIEKFKKLGK